MYISKINIPKQIIILFFLSAALLLFRVLIFGDYSLVYMFWNIFLAIIPFFLSTLLLSYIKNIKYKRVIFITVGVIWLLFLPNAPYLVTDLTHIHFSGDVPSIYDALLLFSSAWLGIILFSNSLFHIEQIFRSKFSKRRTNILVTIIIFLTSFGVYLGRFLRFNSWDVFANHISFLKGIFNLLSTITFNIQLFLYTILFFVFIYVSYYAWKSAKL